MENETEILFLYSKEYNEVTAVFLDILTDYYDCYSHIGQHGQCCLEWIKEQKKATKKQYLPLLEELKKIGYKNIKITK